MGFDFDMQTTGLTGYNVVPNAREVSSSFLGLGLSLTLAAGRAGRAPLPHPILAG